MSCCGRRSSFNDMSFGVGDVSNNMTKWVAITGIFFFVVLIIFLIWYFVAKQKTTSTATSTEEQFRKISRKNALENARKRRLVK